MPRRSSTRAIACRRRAARAGGPAAAIVTRSSGRIVPIAISRARYALPPGNKRSDPGAKRNSYWSTAPATVSSPGACALVYSAMPGWQAANAKSAGRANGRRRCFIVALRSVELETGRSDQAPAAGAERTARRGGQLLAIGRAVDDALHVVRQSESVERIGEARCDRVHEIGRDD